jgi:hypothetical protein
MSEQMEEFARRLAALEERVDQEAGLRASGDRDLADMAQTLRAHQMSIQALSITQAQHNDLLRDQARTLERHGQALVASHDKLDLIIGMLTSLSGNDGGGTGD